ncbi:MAG: head-tail connector protein, partial [Terriglobales bacterium]
TWDFLLQDGFPGSYGSGVPCWDVPPVSGVYQMLTGRSSEIRIPRAPLKVNGGIVHVKYLDAAGAQQTLAAGTDYVVAARSEPARVMPAYGKSWPGTRNWIDATGNYPVEVRFIGGYGADPKDVPENFRQAILLLVGHWYENREEVSEASLGQIPMAAEALLWQERYFPW